MSASKPIDEDEDAHSEALLWAVRMCFNSKTFADVKIHIGEVELPAHGIVLSAQSDYFKAALESNMKEGIERKFEYSEGSMQAYWRVFEYMYRGEYSDEAAVPLGSIDDDDELSKDVRVYQLADYFRVDSLKDYALQNLELKFKRLWVSEVFVGCIRDVYESTSDASCELRRAIVRTTRIHLPELWRKKAFRELVREGGEFVIDVMSGMIAGKCL